MYTLIGSLLGMIAILHYEKLLSILRNHFDGLATLFSAFVVILVYFLEKNNKKINAARLVLKEIDGAIPVALALANEGKYDQKSIAIATDNWPNQIQFFVKDMSQVEIDQISKIYAVGRYIHRCIERSDEYKKTRREEIYQKELDKPENTTKSPSDIINSIQFKVDRDDNVPNALINFAAEAAKEIKDAKGWAGYIRLRQIARIK